MGITFLSYPFLAFTSESTQKRGGISPDRSHTPCCNTYKKAAVENLENFQDSSIYELLNSPEITNTVSPEYIYNLLTSGYTDIDNIISRLEKEEIIGENPTKHWECNKIVCKLELKDLSFRIQKGKIYK